MASITITPCPDLAALADRWRTLEAACDGGFFRGWCFLAAHAARFGDPYLLAARQDGQDLALALLNRHRGRFFVGEAGDPDVDSVFVEHNGVLVRPMAGHVLAPALAACCAIAPTVLSGVDQAHRDAAAAVGLPIDHATRFAPAVALATVASGYLDSLSANARAQIRRAMRLYGPELALSVAEDEPAARRYFDELVALHQASWRRRGKPGAFAAAAQRQFHHALISAAHKAGQADLLRIGGAGAVIGYLYNFRHQGRVFAYQSGFALTQDARLKPGLVCHALAIEHYRMMGMRAYDLLGGADRYKTTLAPHAGQALHWFTLYNRGSLRGRVLRYAAAARAWIGRHRRLP